MYELRVFLYKSGPIENRKTLECRSHSLQKSIGIEDEDLLLMIPES